MIPNPERVYSLHIGINDYPNSPLKLCVNDVRAVAARMRQWGMLEQNIVVVPSKEATTAVFKRALLNLVQRTPTGGYAFFQFSGHGSNLPCNDEADAKMEIMCPNDIADDFENNNVSDDFFAGVIRSASAKGVTMFAMTDCCHSGDLTRAMEHAASLAPEIRFIEAPSGAWYREHRRNKSVGRDETRAIAMIGGCRSDEVSYEYAKAKLGALTWAFLAETKTDKVQALSLHELHKAISKRVTRVFPEQHPCLEGHASILSLTLFTTLS